MEALKRWLPEAPQEANFAATVRRLVDVQPGRRVEAKGGTIWRERDALRFLPKTAEGADVRPHLIGLGETISLPQGRLALTSVPVPARLGDDPDVAFLDKDRLLFPLTVRPWQSGDRFRPLGLGGSKKVSDLLTDTKVPAHRRRDVLVVLSADEIAWVVGHRLAAAVRLRPETRQAVRLHFEPAAE